MTDSEQPHRLRAISIWRPDSEYGICRDCDMLVKVERPRIKVAPDPRVCPVNSKVAPR